MMDHVFDELRTNDIKPSYMVG